MSATNFFKLNLKHPVLKQFAEDHYLLICLYKKSYEFLQNFENVDAETEEDCKYYSHVFLKELTLASEELQDKYNNFLISYHSFKSLAASNKTIEKEFKKLPKNITELSDYLETLIEGYHTAVLSVKEILDNVHRIERGE